MKKINGFRIGKGFGCLAQKQKFYDQCTTLQFLRQSAKLSNMYWCLRSTILLLIAIVYNNGRAKRAGKFWNANTKNTHNDTKDLEILFSDNVNDVLTKQFKLDILFALYVRYGHLEASLTTR